VARRYETVDRLQEGKPSAGSKDSVALPQALQLVLHVDEHGTDRDDIDGRVVDLAKIIDGADDEPASVQHACLSRVVTAQTEQICGEVAEDRPARWARTFESAEADQPITRPEVKDDISLLDVRSIQQAIPYWDEECLKQRTTKLVVSAVAMPDDPPEPGVTVGFVHHLGMVRTTLPVCCLLIVTGTVA